MERHGLVRLLRCRAGRPHLGRCPSVRLRIGRWRGDAKDHRYDIRQDDVFARLGLAFDEHGKNPDLVVYDEQRGWLFLMEAVTSHGPIDFGRREHLKKLFATDKAGLVFVNCFPDRATMRKWLADLAWETEAWVADAPDHLIHLNGSRFLGPYE
ncbi:BsuBI/PstI family type II restriction endonuclease [Streptomyces sp. NPDC088251]|uniref:BsuBI/PstI family type II restriction endonuclease n=1 Tax=unclassified Streptomyces TaxID=2593676 RepID=UPI0037FB06A4